MMCIKTISDSVCFPLALGNPQPVLLSGLSQQLHEFIQQARLWHVILWKDESAHLVGLQYRAQTQIIDLNLLKDASISFTRIAKGAGHVAFELFYAEQPSLAWLESHYDEAALSWLIQHKAEFESALECKIAIHDCGFDC